MPRLERPSLVLQLVHVGKYLGYLLERRLASRGLNRTQTLVLTALRRHPGLKVLDLCGPARVEPANVTRTVQSLERLGLLERRPHPTDGRASLFYLTSTGDALARELAEDLERLSAELLQDVDPRELANLEVSLDSLRSKLRGMAGFEHPHCNHQTSDPDLEEQPAGEVRGPNG